MPHLPKIIALYSSAPQSGKSTVANYLVAQYGYARLPLAQTLKEMARPIFRAIGYDDEMIASFESNNKHANIGYINTTPRKIYQTLGTEWGRDIIDKDIWIKLWLAQVDRYDLIVVDDLRFQNEYDTLEAIFATFIRIESPHSNKVDTSHPSEGALDNALFQATITNDGTKEQLYSKVDQFLGVEC